MRSKGFSVEDQIILFGAGWRALSLVDVYGKASFTLWLCGCNLKCPFCHNHRLAECDRSLCGRVDVKSMMEKLNFSRKLVDCFLVSGGEPLLQYRELARLLKHVKADLGVKVAVNSNLTLASEVKSMLEDEVCDYILTDLKAPHLQLYGLPEEESETAWRMYLESLEALSGHDVTVEVRVPAARNVDLNMLEAEAREAFNILDGCNFYVRVNPILGEPYVYPRDRVWALEHCNPSARDVEGVLSVLVKLGLGDRIV